MTYYALKSNDKNRIDGNVICFVGPIKMNHLDVEEGIKIITRIYLSSMYVIDYITKSEVETYTEFGIAPLISPSELGMMHVRGDNPFIGYADTE